MTVYKNGEKKTSLAKDIREQILDRADTGEIMITDKVYDVIAALDDGNKSSVAKYKRMLERADDEDRVSGAFVYAGASTIRYTSRGLQLHNFKRDCLSPERTEELKRTMATGFQVSVGNVMDTLSKALRPTIVPGRGNVLIVGDFKSIENRGLPWLANSPGALNKLATFKQIDDDPTLPDMYVRAATEAGTDDRQVGKVIELSMGFGGANGAFHSMARNYGVHLPDAIVTGLVQTWRNNNQWAVDFWNGLERAAKRAINNPGTVQECGRVSYTYNADMMGGSLFCELPCGQILTYPSCRLEEVDGRHGPQYTITALKANWKPAADAKEWPRYALWRGLLAENVTQAACASLTRWLVRQFDNVVLHCHDEVALECSVGQAAEQKQLLQTTMETGPAWAKGLPLKAPVAVMARYGK